MTEQEFDALVSAGPIVDNAGTLHPLGYLEGDVCPGCEGPMPGDVDRCDGCEVAS